MVFMEGEFITTEAQRHREISLCLCASVVNSAGETVSEPQFPDQILKFVLLRLKFSPGPRALETAMNKLNPMRLVHKYRCWIGEEVVQLTMNLSVDVVIVHAAAKQERVGNTKPILEELEILPSKGRIFCDFEGESHNLETIFSILFLELCKDWSLIHTVVTPRPHNVDNQRLAFESLICTANRFAGQRKP